MSDPWMSTPSPGPTVIVGTLVAGVLAPLVLAKARTGSSATTNAGANFTKVDPFPLLEPYSYFTTGWGAPYRNVAHVWHIATRSPIGWYLVEQVCVGDLPAAATSQLISANPVAEGLLATGYC